MCLSSSPSLPPSHPPDFFFERGSFCVAQGGLELRILALASWVLELQEWTIMPSWDFWWLTSPKSGQTTVGEMDQAHWLFLYSLPENNEFSIFKWVSKKKKTQKKDPSQHGNWQEIPFPEKFYWNKAILIYFHITCICCCWQWQRWAELPWRLVWNSHICSWTENVCWPLL